MSLHPIATDDDEQVRRRLRGCNIPDNERVATATTGAVLVLVGAHQGGWGGVALCALGGALIARGAIGRCPIYRSLAVAQAGADAVTRARSTSGRVARGTSPPMVLPTPTLPSPEAP